MGCAAQPDNFLFLTTEEDSPLKATDFGLSIRHWPDEPKLTSRSGTPAYMVSQLQQAGGSGGGGGVFTYQVPGIRHWADVVNCSLVYTFARNRV